MQMVLRVGVGPVLVQCCRGVCGMSARCWAGVGPVLCPHNTLGVPAFFQHSGTEDTELHGEISSVLKLLLPGDD
jgi:hypothetical protein